MTVKLEPHDDGVWVLRLCRPHCLNALDDDTVHELHAVLSGLVREPACRVLLLTGEGRGFCAGFDLALADSAPGIEHGETQAWMARQEIFASSLLRLRELRQPVIAVVNGPANGAGLGLALGADLRIASTAASFNAAFIKVGMSGCDIGVSYLLPRCVGVSRANEMMLTGRMVNAAEAERIGLVSQVTSPEALMGVARELGREIAAHDGFAVWMTKRGMWANLEASSLQAALELENRTQILTRTTGVLATAAKAMKARKRPV
jgi:enoyl-CoA hydratase